MRVARAAQGWLAFGLILLLLILSPWGAKAATIPNLAQIKARAEQGDPEAQDRLGDAYKSRADFLNATKWYRPAAEHGIAHSQWSLGMILLTGKPGSKDRAVAADPDAGIRWLLRAANQGLERAQLDIGHCFRDGTAIKPDKVEAYKWYAVAARNDTVWRAMFLDPLVLQMTSTQIAEAQRRAEAFQPTPEGVPLPEPACFSQLVLKGITGPKSRRLALINKQTFLVGDEQDVKLDGKVYKVRCLEIRDRSVLVSVLGFDGQKELPLP
jgi:hypothetical protein